METASTPWNTFSNQNQPNPFQQPNTQFGPSTVSQTTSLSSFASPFGSTGRVLGTSPVGDSYLDQPQSNSVSGAPSTTIFGVPRNLGWDFKSTPSIFHANSAHGSTNSTFGVPSMPSLPPESASSGFSTSVLGLPSTKNSFGSGFPLFGSTSSSVSSCFSGPQSTSAIHFPGSSKFSFSTPFQNSSNSASAFHSSSSNSVHGLQSSGPQCKTVPWGIGSTTGKQCKGSDVAPYSATREIHRANDRNSLEKLQSISAMPIYSDKSHEELRMEDYESRDTGGNTPQGNQYGFERFTTKENIFGRPTALNFSASNPLFNPSNSKNFVTPATTISAASPITKPVNTFAPSPYTFSPQSHSFQPQSTVTSSVSSFTSTLNPFSSLNSVSQPIPSNYRQFTPFSTTFTSSSFNTISSNKQPFTFSPSIQPTFLPQSTVTSTTTAFPPIPNPFSSLNPVTQSTTANNCFPSLSKLFTSSPFNSISSSEPSFTFTPFTQSAFQPQSSVTSSIPAFTMSTNTFSSLTPVNQSITSNNCQLPKSSTVITYPLFSSSEPICTFSPSILSASEKTLGPFQSSLNASQTWQAVPNLNFPSNSNLNESSLAQTAVAKVSQVDSQNVSVQKYVSSSTVNEQLPCIQNPFGPQIGISISNCQPASRIFIQTGISSLSVSDNPSPVRKAPHLRIRHWSSRHNRYPVQRLNSGSKELKVPFFSDTEDKPCTVAPLMPRTNPRSWVSNSSSLKENTPLNACDNGAKCSENKAFATSSSQPDATSPEATHKISLREEDFDELLPLLPKLRPGDYYTEPPINLLAENERAEPGFCSHVRDFVVGRRDYGSIKFLGETDVRHLDLESIIQFNKREVILYLNDLNKPPVGQSLNKPAEVTLLNVKCIDKKTGALCTDDEKVRRYKAMLIKKTDEVGAEFVAYDAVEGVWKFRVKHF